jgi:hypothetical protein
MMAVNDVFRMAVSFNVPNATGPVVITHYFRQTAQIAVLTGNALMEDVSNAWTSDARPELLATQSSLITLTGVSIRGITNNMFGFDLSMALLGSRTPPGESLVSPRSAPVVSIRTGLIGRSFRGRNFLPPPNETDQDSGFLSTTVRDLIDDYYDALRVIISPGSSNEYSHTVYSPTLSEGGPVVDNLVESVLVRFSMGTIRGRMIVS